MRRLAASSFRASAGRAGRGGLDEFLDVKVHLDRVCREIPDQARSRNSCPRATSANQAEFAIVSLANQLL
jgi:hypothetical protein